MHGGFWFGDNDNAKRKLFFSSSIWLKENLTYIFRLRRIQFSGSEWFWSSPFAECLFIGRVLFHCKSSLRCHLLNCASLSSHYLYLAVECLDQLIWHLSIGIGGIVRLFGLTYLNLFIGYRHDHLWDCLEKFGNKLLTLVFNFFYKLSDSLWKHIVTLFYSLYINPNPYSL